MTTDGGIPDDLKDLIDDYLAGLLDEAGLGRLEQRLLADPEARRYFVAYCRLHTDLHLEARARHVGARALLALDEPNGEAGAAPTPAARHPRLRRLLASWPAKLAAWAAIVLMCFGVAWSVTSPGMPQQTQSPHDVAWLVNAQNCQWEGDAAPWGGMRAGTVLRVERGLAELQFASGARVVLEGPAALELRSGNGARLLRGKLTAHVPGPASGFEVLSPQGKLIDLGTEFGVSVDDDGGTNVRVFAGRVKASAGGDLVSLTENQAARLDPTGVTRQPDGAGGFVRAIVPPPLIVPHALTLDFRRPRPGTLEDRGGRGTGLTHRLPGTGGQLAAHDDNLLLDPDAGRLTLTTTDSDINRQVNLDAGEYPGVRLSDLGFTGAEDFAVAVAIPNIPALRGAGQFGLYAGTKGDRNVRGGVISKAEPGQYAQFMANNNGGRDSDAQFVGLSSVGDDLRLTLRRTGGKYSLSVDNATAGGSTTLAIRHPDFLDGERDLYVGLFGANSRGEERKTLVIKEVQVTVWTASPAR
jgi:hypothetical protein